METVRAFLDAENRRDWEGWASFLHPDVVYEVVGEPSRTLGREEYVRRMKKAYEELPDWRFELVRMHGDGRSVVVEFDGAGHFTGEHRGRRHERLPLRLTSVCVFELMDGRIKAVREYLDAAGFERQLAASGPIAAGGSAEGPFSGLAGRYNGFDASLGQVVRRALISRALDAHLPPPPARVVDVGGGAGQQSIPLAREGYEVAILDPSPEMLAEARLRLGRERDEVRGRVRLVEGFGEEAPETFGAGAFDAALCHGVVMYLEDPYPLVRALADAVRPGGAVSVLAKNAAALAVRPALKGEYGDALAALDAGKAPGGLGVVTRGDTVEGLSGAFGEAGLAVERWYGVRVFTDHLGDRSPGPELADVLELEWEAGLRDPYRCVARLLHLVGRKGAEGP